MLDLAIARGVAIGAGVEFDDSGACAARRFDLRGIGADEERDAAAVGAELFNEWRDPVVAAENIQPAFRRPLFAAFGHEAHGVRAMLQRVLAG